MPSSAQVIAASGLVNGEGFAVNPDLTSGFSSYNSQPLTVVITNMYSPWSNGQPRPGPNTVSNVSGLKSSLDSLPSWVTGFSSYTKISSVASTNASNILGSGVTGNKNFASFLNQSAGYGQATLGWHAAIQQYQGKGFSDFGLQNKGYNDIVTGGMTGHWSGLSSLPGGSQAAFQNLGSALSGMGGGMNLNDLTNALGPSAMVTQMRNKGLYYTGDLNEKLANAGITTDEEVLKADPKLLRSILNSINSSSDVDTTIQVLGIKVPNNVRINNVGDLVDANKMLPPNLRSLAPSGNMSDLNKALGGMGGQFGSAAQLGQFLGKTEVPDLKLLNGLSSPLPSSYITNLAPIIGKGDLPAIGGQTFPLGTGPIGNPLVTDMLGSAAGIGIVDSFKKINQAHTNIMNSSVGQDLKTALTNVYTADTTPPYTVSGTLTTTLNTAITNFNRAVSSDPELSAANKGMLASAAQITRENTLLPMAGVSLSSPPTVSGMTGILNMAANLPKYGVDKQNLGFKDLFAGIANKNTITGQAILAALYEGRGQSRSASVSIPDNITADPTAILSKAISSNASKDLTDQQKQNIIADARALGIDQTQALNNAKTFGYNNNYFVSKGYPSAS